MAVIDIHKASLVLKNNIIFTDMDMQVEQGQCHALIGGDNEGKSSLLYAIVGQNALTSGEILLFDEYEPKQRAQFMKRVGYVPDELLCFENMTGAQLLDKTLQLRQAQEWINYVEGLIEYFGVDPSLQLTEMSDDMNKCIYIINAILDEPDLLILDEPFNFLENKSIVRFKAWLQAYVADGKTVLITSDSYEAVSDICDVISVVKDRTIVTKNMPVPQIQTYKLITVRGINIYSIPPEVKVVEQNMRCCKLCFKGGIERLKEVLQALECDDFNVSDVTVDDVLFHTYDWLEALVW